MFYLKNPKRPNHQSANMAYKFSYIMLFWHEWDLPV